MYKHLVRARGSGVRGGLQGLSGALRPLQAGRVPVCRGADGGLFPVDLLPGALTFDHSASSHDAGAADTSTYTEERLAHHRRKCGDCTLGHPGRSCRSHLAKWATRASPSRGRRVRGQLHHLPWVVAWLPRDLPGPAPHHLEGPQARRAGGRRRREPHQTHVCGLADCDRLGRPGGPSLVDPEIQKCKVCEDVPQTVCEQVSHPYCRSGGGGRKTRDNRDDSLKKNVFMCKVCKSAFSK